MSLYMPGAVQRPQPGGVSLDTSLPPRFIWHITWDQLRADGTQPDFSAVANYLIGKEYCPHIMWNPFTGYMEQYYPANVGGRALAYNNQDGAAAVQVEVFFTPGCVVDGVKYNTVADTPVVGWEDLLAWGDSLGVPREWPMGAPQWSGNSRDVGTWNNNAGHYGHCHSPGDTHTDPGPMPALTGTISTQSATITPVKEWDEMATPEELRAVIRDELMQSAKQGDQGRALAWFNWREHPIPGWNGNVSAAARLAGIDQAVNDIRAGLGNLPAQILNQQFKLPDGTVTNLAGILAAIHATPVTAGGAPADPAAVAAAVLAGLKDQINK